MLPNKKRKTNGGGRPLSDISNDDNSIHRKNVAPKSHLTRISPVAPGKFVITSRISHILYWTSMQPHMLTRIRIDACAMMK
uniref:Uncharacterized protein n=1 Tax=Medicago truncatula TaxID=3880 RepID=Q2HS91_MEDTR|nr:hypothetical protein MtrDRAFT_AC155883g4v2 [Medicago truncatula]